MIETSVIMCTRNGASTIGDALDSLAAQVTDVAWELIVVDNGSTDRTVEVVRSHAGVRDRLRVVDASTRAGLAHARNVGVDAARGTYVAFCDDDDEVAVDWLEEITAALRVHRFVGCSLDYERLNEQSDWLGRARVQSEELGSVFGYTVVNGACGIERSLWSKVGGNDESLVVSSEDHDFSIRVQQQCDVTPVLAERAVYFYRLRPGLRASFRQGLAYGYGHVQLFVRYGPRKASAADRRAARRAWWWIISRAPVHLLGRRATWARQLGMRVGRLRGSIAYRRWCP